MLARGGGGGVGGGASGGAAQGVFLASNGLYAEAMTPLLRALLLRQAAHPAHLDTGKTLHTLGACYDYLGALPSALGCYEAAARVFGACGHPAGPAHLAASTRQAAGARAALAQQQQQQQQPPSPAAAAAAAAHAEAAAEDALRRGDHAAAAAGYAALAAAAGRSGAGGGINYNLACCLVALGRRGEALSALEAAAACGFPHAEHAAADGDLAALRGEPRFAAAVGAMRASAARGGPPPLPQQPQPPPQQQQEEGMGAPGGAGGGGLPPGVEAALSEAAARGASREELTAMLAAAGVAVVQGCAQCRQAGHSSKDCPSRGR